VPDYTDAEKELQKRKQAIFDQEDYKSRISGMSDDEILAEWEAARKDLAARQDAHQWMDLYAAPGEPLRGSMNPRRIPERTDGGLVGSRASTYRVSVGSPEDVRPNTHTTAPPSGSPQAADGLARMEEPFSALTTELHNVNPKSAEYQRVQALYGPARIAYARKNNLSLNTGEPKK
jgi:hypothetical protein